MFPRKKWKKFNDDVIDLDNSTRESCFENQYSDDEDDNETSINFWLEKYKLTTNDKILIEKDGWLNDKHMNAVNALLRNQFGLSQCLQNTLNVPFHVEKRR